MTSTMQHAGHVHSPEHPRYRQEIDGLRCIAVMPVVLFHAGVTLFSGGFVGVDIFFVISGYLITGILYREASAGRFSIVNFYERRVRRIFPALFTMLAVVLAVGMAILLPDEIRALARQAIATTLFSSNLLFWSETGYFDQESVSKPLLHTWSLAVEEQYYIFFPLILWAIMKWRPRTLLPLLVAGTLLSLALSIVGLKVDASGTFYLLPTRAWELLIGGIVAIVPSYRGKLAELLCGAGLAAITASVLLYNESMPFPGLAALPPCLGAAAILWAGEGSWCGRAISMAPVRFLGLISYSLYLWHWPIIVYLSLMYGSPLPTSLIVGAIMLSIALAAISWRYVERPLRKTRDVKRVWITAAGCIGGGVALAATILALHGLPGRWSSAANAMVAQAVADKMAMKDAYACNVQRLDPKVRVFGPCPIGAASDRVRLVVIGDSQAMAMKPAFSAALTRAGASGMLISVAGCSPLLDLDRVSFETPCAKRSRAIREYVARARPDAVMFVGAWRGALLSKNTVFEGRTSSDDASRLANVGAALRHTVASYRALGARTAMLLPIPGAPVEVPRALARGSHTEISYSSEEHRKTYARLANEVRSAGFDRVEDLATGFCNDRCMTTDRSGHPLYWDNTHLNAAGNKLVEPTIEVAVRGLLNVR